MFSCFTPPLVSLPAQSCGGPHDLPICIGQMDTHHKCLRCLRSESESPLGGTLGGHSLQIRACKQWDTCSMTCLLTFLPASGAGKRAAKPAGRQEAQKRHGDKAHGDVRQYLGRHETSGLEMLEDPSWRC